MLPLVIEELKYDLIDYGICFLSIVDNEDEFSIRRYDPTLMELFYT